MIKNLHKRTHFIRLISFLLIASTVIVFLCSTHLQQYSLLWIRNILDFKPLYTGIIAISLLMGFYYSLFYVRAGRRKEISLIKVFGPFFDPPVNSLGYGLALSSTLTLFRGIFNQLFFHVPYFNKLEFVDVATIMLACIPLLIWSTGGLITFFITVFIKNDSETGTVESINSQNQET
jgi:hypothetical protein